MDSKQAMFKSIAETLAKVAGTSGNDLVKEKLTSAAAGLEIHSKTILQLVFGRQNSTIGRARILGIAGATCTGKSTLAKELLQELRKNGLSVDLLGQDNFYKRKEEVRMLRNVANPSIVFYDYDQVEALNQAQMLQTIRKLSASLDVILVEGNMITDLDLFAEIDYTVFLTIDKEACKSRRVHRIYDPPDEEGYFDQIVWPAYEKTLAKVRAISNHGQHHRIAFINSSKSHIPLGNIVAEFQHLICDQIELTRNRIDPARATDWVNSVSCGATSIFIGTTRDTFGNKGVQHLEYEAYQEMAHLELSKLCKEVRRKHPSVLKIAIFHRLGNVPIGEKSVIIATGAPQRKAAIEATEWLINALKERAPIWKKELYTDGTCSWKENSEQPRPML